ncbi:hypothetical protein F9802_02790 [Bacillus aerolatus]|uniref:Uncharacterized protein n=1 Tax=Bacillus aerolatus TaxID=2653354 RepID=A0A6I1FK44_9BACI|nr:hypothetical protein [Bacillus aerolatus]KAB7709068.1 hypothetical protein F9802_02790 [Bacillus aerolatus]
MLSIHFKDWGKKRPKKHYKRLHEMRIFELIFSKKLSELGVKLGEFDTIIVYCLANPNKTFSYDKNYALEEINVLIPYDYMSFLNLDSTQAKFQVFTELVRLYIVPILEKYSTLSPSTISTYVEEALEEVVKQNYEAVFLVGKTPKKSPSRKKLAILKGIHRSEGFQLRCEVYNEKGMRVIDQLLAEDVGNEMVYSRFLGTIKWENEHLIIVRSKSSQWMEEVHVTN